MQTGTIGAIPELERTILDPEAIGRILADDFVEIGADVVQALYRIVRTIDGRWQMTFHQGTPTRDP